MTILQLQRRSAPADATAAERAEGADAQHDKDIRADGTGAGALGTDNTTSPFATAREANSARPRVGVSRNSTAAHRTSCAAANEASQDESEGAPPPEEAADDSSGMATRDGTRESEVSADGKKQRSAARAAE